MFGETDTFGSRALSIWIVWFVWIELDGETEASGTTASQAMVTTRSASGAPALRTAPVAEDRNY